VNVDDDLSDSINVFEAGQRTIGHCKQQPTTTTENKQPFSNHHSFIIHSFTTRQVEQSWLLRVSAMTMTPSRYLRANTDVPVTIGDLQNENKHDKEERTNMEVMMTLLGACRSISGFFERQHQSIQQCRTISPKKRMG
jgi:hypothetical protein